MKTMFSRQFALTAGLILVCMLVLGLAFRAFMGRYAASQAQQTLSHNAEAVT